MDVTANNQWVNSYIEALLSTGLSAEHVQSNNGLTARFAAPGDDEHTNTVAAYYVHQILSLDETALRDAWLKASTSTRVTAPGGLTPAERDARTEYLSWRVWGMKRRMAEVQQAVDAHRRETAEDMDPDDLATTVREDLLTIDELNSTISELDELKPFDSGSHDDVPGGTDDVAAIPDGGSSDTASPPMSGIKATDVNPFVLPPSALRLPSLSAGIKGSSTAVPPKVSVTSPTFASPFASALPSPATLARKHASQTDLFRASWGGTGMPPSSPPAATPGGTHAIVPPAAPDSLLVNRFPRLYVILISLHGLVRGEKMELGKDPDTGGQVKYVVELAKALGQFPSVARVDLLTRLIADPKVDSSYAEPEERLNLSPLPVNVQAGLASCANEVGSPVSPSSSYGAYIVRLPCGPRNVYLRKEDLWPHVREFADRAIAHATATLARLQESGPCELYVVHGHYADAGEAAGLIASSLGADCVLTGHSLGRNKKEHLLKSGTMGPVEVESTYRVSRRIEAEERALDYASVVFTSTQQEVEQQWGTYDGYSEELSAALQLRPCRGYHVPRMAVIPPGLDFSNLKVQMPVDPWEEVLGIGKVVQTQPATPFSGALYSPGISQMPSVVAPVTPNLHESAAAADGNVDLSPPYTATATAADEAQSTQSGGGGGGLTLAGRSLEGAQQLRGSTPASRLQSQHGAATPTGYGSSNALASCVNPVRMAGLLVGENEPTIWKEINKFLRFPGRPVILAMARPDAKKNLIGLLKAYGESRLLRDLANLVLVMGNRDQIDAMAPGSCRVLTDVLKLVDAYDLYGLVAYPKKHTQADITDIYLLAAATRGIFVNVALQEPFGLTLIEAAAHGVPIVATTHGGPVDIIATLKNGTLVEPTNTRAISDALIALITGQRKWDEASESGRRNIIAYSWPSHCARYLRTVEDQKKNLANTRVVGKGQETKANAHKAAASNIRIRHTLSLSYDDLSEIARAIAVNTTSASSADIIQDAVAVVAAAAAAGGPAKPGPAAEQQSAMESALGRTSAPSVFTDLRTFSTPLSQAFINGLQRRAPRSGSKAGGLSIPAPEDIALALAKAVDAQNTDAPKASGSTLQQPIANVRVRPDASASTKGASITSEQARAPSAHLGGESLVPEASGKLTMQSISEVNDGTAAAAAAADKVEYDDTVPSHSTCKQAAPLPDPSKWGSDTVVESVLAAAINALSDEGSAGKHATMKDKRPGSGGRSREGGRGSACDAYVPASDQSLIPTLSFKAAELTKSREVQPRMFSHQNFLAFNFDSIADVKTCAPIIRALLYGPSGVSAQVLQYARLLTGGTLDAQAGAQLGVGVMCTWGTKDLRSFLHAEGIEPNSLDFMVCNAGALIWHSTVPVSGSGSGAFQRVSDGGRRNDDPTEALASPDASSANKLLCDDEWERYIDWRWDDRVVKQVLGRVMDNKGGWGRLNIVRTDSSLPTGSKKHHVETKRAASGVGGTNASSNTHTVYVNLSPASSPLHFMLDFEVQTPANFGVSKEAANTSVSDIAKQLLSIVRRKLRKSGLRAQLLITPRESLPSDKSTGADSPSKSGRSGLTALINSIAATLTRTGSGAAVGKAGDMLHTFVLHITPLRCSRALALRHIARCSRHDLASYWTLAACPVALSPPQDGKPVPLTSGTVSGSIVPFSSSSPGQSQQQTPVLMLSGSDGEDLVAGVQRVVLLPHNKLVTTLADVHKASGESSALPFVSVACPVDVNVYQAKVLKPADMDESTQQDTGIAESSRVLVLL